MSIARNIARQLPLLATHHAGTLGNDVLRRIEELIGASFERTMETGCGKSTIFFSQASNSHLCFTVDDRNVKNSSVAFVESNPLFRPDRCQFVLGPTQKTLPSFAFEEPFDVVLLDGPHGYPFPELEYYFVYPYIKNDGYLIIDDVNIPSIGCFADMLFEDPMFELVETVLCTAVFRRTAEPLFDPTGDGWWTQPFNRRRINARKGDLYLADRKPVNHFSSRGLDEHLMHGRMWIPDEGTPPLRQKFAIAGLKDEDISLPSPGWLGRWRRRLSNL